MKKYTVILTDDALKDLDSLHDYIEYNLLSPRIADRLCSRISNAILSLELFPERHRIFTYAEDEPIRRMLVENFSVLYALRDSFVYVLHVFYSASDLEERLKN